MAAQVGNVDAVRAMMESVTKMGSTLSACIEATMMKAIESAQTDMVKFLLETPALHEATRRTALENASALAMAIRADELCNRLVKVHG